MSAIVRRAKAEAVTHRMLPPRRAKMAGYACANPPYVPRPTASYFAFWNVFADDALVTLQSPIVIRPLGEPIGNSNLRVYRTGAEGNARLITGGNDFLKAKLAVAENGDESNEHGDLRC